MEQEDIYTCPICTETAERRTVTSCGHFFCSDCLAQALAVKSMCPLCRRHLTRKDCFDACTSEEAAAAATAGTLDSFSTKVRRLSRPLQFAIIVFPSQPFPTFASDMF